MLGLATCLARRATAAGLPQCGRAPAAVASAAAAPVAASAPLLQLLRHKGNRAGRGNGVWWQPLLPALAPQLVPETPGKGNRKKKMQQRRAQSVTDHARRKEGHRRSAIFAQLNREAHHDRVRQVYRDHAELLRRGALEGSGGAPSGAGGATGEER